jgi:hypothetical protein
MSGSAPARLATRLGRSCARALLRCYPPRWRRRYGTEATALLGRHQVRPRTLADMIFGVLDAWLHPDLIPGEQPSMTRRVRTAQFAVFCSTFLYASGVVSLSQVRDPGPPWQAAIARHSDVGRAVSIAILTGEAAVAAGVAGFVLLSAAMLHQALTGDRTGLLRPLIGQGVLALAWLAITGAVAGITASRPGTGIRPLRTLDLILEFTWLAATVVALVIGAALMWRALTTADLPKRAMLATQITATVTAAAMTTGVVATLVAAGLLLTHAPNLISRGWLTTIITALTAAAMITAAARRRMATAAA